MNRKKLIIIAFFMFILIILLIVILGKTGSMDKGITNPSALTDFKSNSEKLIDYDAEVIKYGNKVYFLDELSNSIITYDLKNKNSEKVVDLGSGSYGKKFFIRSNHLIFSKGNKSYYCDLDGKNINNLSNGEVIYIDDDVYLFISHGSSRDELYITSYNYKNFRTTTNMSHNIASGRSIMYLKSQGNNVYVTSINSDNTTSLLEIDIKNSKVTLISRLDIDSGTAMITNAFSDVLKDKDYYYYTTKEIISSYYTSEESRGYLYSRGISNSIEELLTDNVGYHLSVDPKIKDEVLYEQYDEEDLTDTSEWLYVTDSKETDYSWKELIYGDVSEYFSLNDTAIYMNNEKLLNLELDIYNYSLGKVIRLDDGFYFYVQSDEKHMWYHCNEDGSNLEKIYEGKNKIELFNDEHFDE